MGEQNNKLMNVLQIRGEFSDNGPGTQMLTISKELMRRGHMVDVAASGGLLKEKIEESGCLFHVIPELSIKTRNFFQVIRASRKLGKVMKDQKIDVVHAHNAATLYIAYFGTLLAGISKSVRLFHSCRGIELRKYYGWRNWVYLKYPAHIFAVCQWTKNQLVNIGVKENRITVTFNGVDFERFNIEKREEYGSLIRKELDIPSEAIIIGTIGRLGTKGHDEVIKALAKCNFSSNKDVRAILVGGGKQLEEFKALAQNLGVAHKVVFTDVRFDSERMHASFDIFALPSFWGEMFPNAILESMAYGNPIISTNLSGIPEMLTNNEGFIIEPKDTEELSVRIMELVENETLRAKMGQNARETVQNRFSIGVVVDRIENAYRR